MVGDPRSGARPKFSLYSNEENETREAHLRESRSPRFGKTAGDNSRYLTLIEVRLSQGILLQLFSHFCFMPSNKKIIITIDGWSSCGKSTLAKQLAKELGYIYIDSGAMYRAITFIFLKKSYRLDKTPRC